MASPLIPVDEGLDDRQMNRPGGLPPWIRDLYAAVRRHRTLVAFSVYTLLTAAAYSSAYLLRFEFRPSPEHAGTLLGSLPLLIVVRILSDHLGGLATNRWRFVGTRDMWCLGVSGTAGSVVFFVLVALLPFQPVVPRSVILMEWGIRIYLVAGVWLSYRMLYEMLRRRQVRPGWSRRRALLVGAGEAGNMLVREMVRFPTGYRPVGFVDDDPMKLGTSGHGVKVLGATEELESIVGDVAADVLIIAIPSAEPDDLRRIVARCERTDVPFKVLPGIREVLEGGVRVNQLRDLEIEDLLGREPIDLRLPALTEDLRDRSILITGAAGSIGSEVARQVALHDPGTLILFDQAESELYFLDRELRERHPHLPIVPVIGDVVDECTVRDLFRAWEPKRVFHAAAYKHVPLMEMNPREAVRNNVLGTWRLARNAAEAGVEKFVLVSTDKAVSPTSVMGATKRVAEMIVVAIRDRFPESRFLAVRFGNVLDSNGSVIPVFRRQIEAGEPLTVTDPDATRYFMTIPEAVQLILQSSLLPDPGGSILMLEMGEPVRILELARQFLRLSGLPARNGQEIVFTGLRPGEKLHEELVGPDESSVPTSVPKVRMVQTTRYAPPDLLGQIREWSRLLDVGEGERVLSRFLEWFPELRAHARGSGDALAALSRSCEGLGFPES